RNPAMQQRPPYPYRLTVSVNSRGVRSVERTRTKYRRRSPAKSDPATSRVALAAVGKLPIEAGEQRRILSEREPRAGIDLQCVAPGTRTVDREQRSRYRHE